MLSSAGLLIYRWQDHGLQVLLIHPGGPFWQGKDDGAWQIPKGGAQPGEDMLQTALREFEEELGTRPPGEPWRLTRIRQAGGKRVEVFALEGDFEPAGLVSNRFELEWPPGSGRFTSFPEADRAAWFSIGEAAVKILASQAPLLRALEQALTIGKAQ